MGHDSRVTAIPLPRVDHQTATSSRSPPPTNASVRPASTTSIFGTPIRRPPVGPLLEPAQRPATFFTHRVQHFPYRPRGGLGDPSHHLELRRDGDRAPPEPRHLE